MFLAALLGTAGLVGHSAPDGDDLRSYLDSISKFHQEQENDLTRKEGWLTVAGLFWLKEGDNLVGAKDGCTVRLPDGSAPENAGTLTMGGGKVTFHAAAGASFTEDGKPISDVEMNPNKDRLTSGSATIILIQRGTRTGIRMFDSKAKTLLEFKGRKWMPTDPKLRIRAKFVPNDKETMIPITNILGDTAAVSSPGHVEFTIDGKQCRLEAEGDMSGLFFNFTDSTSGKTTYPAGRFLNTPGPKDGFVDIDFNRAVNPPCAFTAFATCPLPPKGNHLSVPIEAGELSHHPGH